MTTPWPVPTAGGPVDATVRVPGSKSLTNRWLVLAALADGPSVLRHPLRSDDSARMVAALQQLGCTVDTSQDDRWSVLPPPGGLGGRRWSENGAPVEVDCGQAGTVMRFVPPLAALLGTPVRFVGHPSAVGRPVGPVLQALRDLGVRVEDEGRGTLPFTVRGPVPPAGEAPHVRVDAGASSQFVSALLLAAPALPGGLVLEHRGGRLPSLPHVVMTVQVLREVGVPVEQAPSGSGSWRVPAHPVRAFDVEVEPDLSSAAPFLALAAVTGGCVRLEGWPRRTDQPGGRLPELLATFGAEVEETGGTLVVRGAPGGLLRAADLDLSDVGELTPVLTALAVWAPGTTRLRGIAHLRGHETDRLAALVAEVRRLGGEARETPDGLEVVGGRPLRGTTLRTYHDHRMAMFGAVLGAVVPGVELEDVGTTAKTFPTFPQRWAEAVASALPTAETDR